MIWESTTTRLKGEEGRKENRTDRLMNPIHHHRKNTRERTWITFKMKSNIWDWKTPLMGEIMRKRGEETTDQDPKTKDHHHKSKDHPNPRADETMDQEDPVDQVVRADLVDHQGHQLVQEWMRGAAVLKVVNPWICPKERKVWKDPVDQEKDPVDLVGQMEDHPDHHQEQA